VWVKTPEYHGNNAGRGVNILTFVRKLGRSAARLAEKYRPEAVISSSTCPLDIRPAAKIARRAGAGLFFEIHDLWPLTPMELGHLSKWNPMIMALQSAENYAYKHSKKIISILPDADKYVRLRGYDDSKVVYVPNGVFACDIDLKEANSPQVETLRRLHSQGRFLVGYTGNHSVSNALEYFIDASALLQKEQVTIVLVGGGNYKDTLVRHARENGCENVLFLDPVPKSEMGALLAELDAAYMGLAKSNLFKYGVSPNKLFDYLLAAKPIIYAVEASNDPVRDAGCGVSVPVGDCEAIARAVRSLIAAGPQGRAELGRRGREYVLQNHEYGALARRYAQALEPGAQAKKGE
ncbi:MAG: glycosyltransferase family 4 protein, partial [Clostridia bacterium]|nr:glycosyltransferase family 4 protein [Clostridia bacterium]